jgi:hypothetical protein
MSWYIGAACTLLAIWIIYKTVTHRRAVVAARERVEANGKELPVSNHPLSAMAAGITPIFAMGIFFSAVAVGAASFTVDTRGLISPIDIAGFIFLAGAYCVWMVMRTHYSPMGLDIKGEAEEKGR